MTEDDHLQLQLTEEAALRARSLQRTRKLRARARKRQRMQRAERVQRVGELVAACGLLWLEDDRLATLLKVAALQVAQQDVYEGDADVARRSLASLLG